MIEQLVKVAAVQAAPALCDLEAAVDRAVALMDEAGAAGVSFLVFPETWISGYPWWIWLGTPADTIHHSGEYFANAIEANSSEEQRLRDAARRNGLYVSVGVCEKAGSTLYMGQWLYGPEGEVIERRRKLKPTLAERSVFGEGDGTDLEVHDTAIGRIGALCCWEHMQPLSKYALFAQGEQIHASAWPAYSVYSDVSHALSAELSVAINKVYAAEGQTFVVCATSVITPELLERLAPEPAQQKLIQTGGGYARIFGPDGAMVGTPLDPEEQGLLIAEINLGQIAYCKAAADPAGHYARPDVLSLHLNRQPRQPLTISGDSTNRGKDSMPLESADAPEASES